MKSILTLLIALITLTTFAQQGINYKAVIKDDLGNVIANDLVQVQFSIRTSINSADNVYVENHTPTTDSNGLVILNIGTGTVTSGDFTTIAWSASDHYLNVQINPGGGYIDMGTTQFMAVPYAKYAATATFAETSGDTKWIEGTTANDITNNNTGDVEINNDLDIGGTLTLQATASIDEFSIDGTLADNSDTALPTEQAVKTYIDTNVNANLATGLEAIDEGNGMGWRLKGFAPANYGAIGFNAKDFSFGTAGTTGAIGSYSFALGINTTASGVNSMAMGEGSIADGATSFALGTTTEALGASSVAMGFFATASGDESTAMGAGTTASGATSTAIGNGTTASGIASTAMGSFTRAEEFASIAMGADTTASGDVSTAIGNTTVASGHSSTAMGNSTTAVGSSSTAMGENSTATGSKSTAMGENTTALGALSTAMGLNTVASGVASVTMGTFTSAPSYAETTLGRYNTNYTLGSNGTTSWNTADRLFVVGNGTASGNRSNALTILKNGKTGIGTDMPNALLHLQNTANTNNPQLELTEEVANSGTRINFKNAVETTNRWTMFARTDNTHTDSQFNIFYSGLTQNVMSLNGNGNVNINGNLALGNITPGHVIDTYGRLRVRRGSSDSAGIWYTDNDGVDRIFSGAKNHDNSNSNLQHWGVYNDGAWRFWVNGNGVATLTGTLFQNSDCRLKTKIKDLGYGLSEVLQLQPKQYFWKDREEQEQASLGLIAQEVENIIPNIVHIGADDKKTLSLSYIELIPVLINAIKEQQKIIENQNKMNSKQISQLEALLSRVEALETNASN